MTPRTLAILFFTFALASCGGGGQEAPSAANPPAAEDIAAVGRGGELRVKPGTIITDWAREIAQSRDVKIVDTGARRLH